MHKICKNLPFFENIKPARKGISRKNNTLFYNYRLEKNYEELKAYYKKVLPKSGWKFIEEDYDIWENQLEFEKDNYWIQISYGNFGNENYATICRNSAITK